MEIHADDERHPEFPNLDAVRDSDSNQRLAFTIRDKADDSRVTGVNKPSSDRRSGCQPTRAGGAAWGTGWWVPNDGHLDPFMRERCFVE
jgi:hypothetical protein